MVKCSAKTACEFSANARNNFSTNQGSLRIMFVLPGIAKAHSNSVPTESCVIRDDILLVINQKNVDKFLGKECGGYLKGLICSS